MIVYFINILQFFCIIICLCVDMFCICFIMYLLQLRQDKQENQLFVMLLQIIQSLQLYQRLIDRRLFISDIKQKTFIPLIIQLINIQKIQLIYSWIKGSLIYRYQIPYYIIDMENQLELKQHEIQRINQLITNFAKSEPNSLKYSQTLMLMLDRCIFSNKFTLGNFHNLFLTIYSKNKQQKLLQQQKTITKDQLVSLLNQIAKILFQSDQKYLHRFYNTFLSQKIQSQNGEINHSRVMVFDVTNARLITEDSIKKITEYEDQLKHIFIAYLFENYWSIKKSKRILLTLREIILQNKKWSFPSLIHYLKDSESTPHLVSVEHLEEVLRLIVPNVNGKQQQFYSKHVLSEGYHKQVQNNQNTTHAGDPGLNFFQLQLIIARIALDSYPKDLQKKGVPSMNDILERYFSYLMFRKNDQISTKPLPNINRKMITVMKQYYKIIQAEKDKDRKKTEVEDNTTAFQKLAKKMNDQIINVHEIGLDFNDIFKNLDKQLPKMPPAPVIQPQYLPPYKKQIAITLGQQPPPQPSQDGQKIKIQKKKQGNKKDQVPPRQFKWAQIPQIKLAGQDYIKQIQSKLNYEIKPLSQIQRGVIKRQVYPVIIAQTLCPPQMPKVVAPYLTAATNAMIDRNFILAIQNYNKGASEWKKTLIQFDAVAQLFFEYSKGCIYLSVGKYQYALQVFYNCRKFADQSKLPFSNPDRSLPFYGLGQVFYELEEYQLAARSFLKARQIRQGVLGLEHVQTASVFNNLAACYYMLGRGQQALGYIQIAQVVLDMQLGQHHQRTMTSRFNLNLISHKSLDNKPQFRKFWQVFEQDKFQKKKKKKKEKQGKKK